MVGTTQMTIRKLPWRFVLPGLILPTSIMNWVQYQQSVRVFDDSPAPWHWYGSFLSASLNFPAYVYSAPAQPFFGLAFKVGRIRIEPRTVLFFVLVFVIWYWIGKKIEGRDLSRNRIPSRILLVLYALGAFLWVWIACMAIFGIAFSVPTSSWRNMRYYLFRDAMLLESICFLWSLSLGWYYSKKFTQGFQARKAP